MRRWVTVDLALLALVVVLVAALLLTWRAGAAPQSAPSDAAARAASAVQRDVTAAAGAETVAFLEVDHEDMDAVAERVLDGATGRFAEEYAAGRDRLVRSVEQRRATVTASLRAVGVADLSERRAVAVVAADSLLVDRSTGDDGRLRKHRLRLVLERDGDAADWRVSGLEFVR